MKNFKHAVYYHNHIRNDGPPLFYFEQLKKIFGKENVHHLIPGEVDVDKWGPYDYHWWIDYGEDSFLGKEKSLEMKIPNDGGKTIYVVSDAHLDDGYRFEKARQFDYVFFNQKHYLNQYYRYLMIARGKWDMGPVKFDKDTLVVPDMGEFIETGKAKASQIAGYLPHAAEPIAYPHFEIIKKYDICFIGHMQEHHKDNTINMSRLDFLDEMFKAFPNFYFGTRHPAFPDKNMFEDAAKHFCESKVVLNISIGNDANMRFFEALMTGSFLLTNDIPELKNLEPYGFKEGKNYITYTTLDEAKEKVRYYLENEEEREAIAAKGYDQALHSGTYEWRIKDICGKVDIPLSPTER
jgi:hypothetical protein